MPTVGSGLLRYASKPTPNLHRTHSAWRYAILAFRIATEWLWRLCVYRLRPISQRSVLWRLSCYSCYTSFFIRLASLVPSGSSPCISQKNNYSNYSKCSRTFSPPSLADPKTPSVFIKIKKSVCRNFAYS